MGGGWKAVAVFGGIAVFLILGWLIVQTDTWKNWSRDFSVDTTVEGFDKYFGRAFSWMTYTFGGIPAWLVGSVGQNSAIVITLFTWLLLFVTFGDILAAFSTFSKPASWVIAFAIAVIVANLKAIVVVLGVFIGFFAFLGGIAVLAGLATAFIAFFAVNWGVGWLGPFVLRRRVMMEAEKRGIETEAGGEEIAGLFRGLGKAQEALRDVSKKKK